MSHKTPKTDIPGTKGYADAAGKFIEATLAIDFFNLHKDFVPLFPEKPGRILDVGAGIGRDAAEFSARGHSVTAVEPTVAFLNAAKELYGSKNIAWINDALPYLKLLGDARFDFILASGVWHHLDEEAQNQAMKRIAGLLNPDGIFALTLRNGPAGVGTHVSPTNAKQTILNAAASGLTTVLYLEDQPSLMRNKQGVSWAKLVFQQSGKDHVNLKKYDYD